MPVRTAHGPKTTRKTAKAAKREAGKEATRLAERQEQDGRQRRARGRGKADGRQRQGGKEAKHARAHCTRPLTTGTAKAAKREPCREATRPAERQEQDGKQRRAKASQQRDKAGSRGGRGRQKASLLRDKANGRQRQGGREESPLFVAQGQCPQCCAGPQCRAGLCRASTQGCARPQAHPSPGASQLAVACSFWNVKVAKRRFFAHF